MRCLLKRVTKLSIVFVYVFLVRNVQDFFLWLSGKKPSNFAILYYHSVKPEHWKKFAQQMTRIKRKTHVCFADESIIQNSRRYSVAVTFDDGYAEVLETAFPVLYYLDLPWTWFLVSDCLGQKQPSWIKDAKHCNYQKPIVRVEEIQKLRGMVRIGSHSASHKHLGSLNNSEIFQELKSSRQKLKKITGKRVCSISFPYGEGNENLIALARDAGYKFCFSNNTIPLFKNNGVVLRNRVDAYADDWNIEFELKLRGGYNILPVLSDWKQKILKVK